MASLIDIKKRITSVKKTKKITQALKMVSAAKLRRAEGMLKQARPFSDKLSILVDKVLDRSVDAQHSFFADRGSKRKLIVVIASDRGLCGSFNGNVLRTARDFIAEHKDDELSLLCIGNKACNYFGKTDVPISDRYTHFLDKLDYSDAGKISDAIIKQYLDDKCDQVYVVYNEFKSVVAQTVRTKKFLPIEDLIPNEINEVIQSDYIYEPSESVVLDNLLKQYITYNIYRFLCESNASEQGARMAAMEAATDNADKVIGEMTLVYNRARQAAITKELSEIVGGAEALSA